MKVKVVVVKPVAVERPPVCPWLIDAAEGRPSKPGA